MIKKINNFFKTLKNNQSGFTLIELMVVLIVIGIISGFVMSDIGFLEQDARNQALDNLADDIRSGMSMQRRRDGGVYPNNIDNFDDLRQSLSSTISLPNDAYIITDASDGLKDGDIPLKAEDIEYSTSDNRRYYMIRMESSILNDEGTETTRTVFIGDAGRITYDGEVLIPETGDELRISNDYDSIN